MIQLIGRCCAPKANCNQTSNGFHIQNFTLPEEDNEIPLTGFQFQNPNSFIVFDNGVLLTQVSGTPTDITEYQVTAGSIFLLSGYTGDRYITIVNS